MNCAGSHPQRGTLNADFLYFKLRCAMLENVFSRLLFLLWSQLDTNRLWRRFFSGAFS